MAWTRSNLLSGTCSCVRSTTALWLADEIHLREIDNLVPIPVENCPESEKAEAFCLLESDGRRHRQFLPAYKNLDQRRSVVLESLLDHWRHLIWRFCRQTKETRSFGQLCEVRVPQICSKIDNPCHLHLQFDKGQ